MKKLLLAGAIALSGLSNAQMTKGAWVISGNTGLGFNNVTTTTKVGDKSIDIPKTNTFSVTPSVGYFVINKLAIGIDLGYINTKTTYERYKNTDISFSIMPTGTYYFTNSSKIVPFLGAGVGYVSNTTKIRSRDNNVIPNTLIILDQSSTIDGLAWKVKGGATYMATQSLGINLGISYDQFSHKDTFMDQDVKATFKTFGVNVGFSYFITGKGQKSDK
ncbi:outer membrane protein [Chryseobacterium ureilyticum]|uniref:Outer membrane protein n=1 Tax=Chryseobacterium ureilyticum TaxID=373668 RepID=A0A1N7L0Q2_9FLAO|nr:outer membrane beta-barrel protein [Chryseobacterium ureilyticum]SIS67429.1 outer membrane protein [Chryseobacterium ureilyticum]